MHNLSSASEGAAEILRRWVEGLDTDEKIAALKSTEKELLFKLAKLESQNISIEEGESGGEVACFED